jgi:hypothetical protein
MNFKEALRIKNGDILYTHAGEKVVVSGWQQIFDNPCIKNDLYFNCIDTSFRSLRYRYDELCGFELCDEDKMFIDWYKNNDLLSEDMILQLKSAFLHGFECGYTHKIKYNTHEQLQK